MENTCIRQEGVEGTKAGIGDGQEEFHAAAQKKGRAIDRKTLTKTGG